jgi:histidinol dehydrogenase
VSEADIADAYKYVEQPLQQVLKEVARNLVDFARKQKEQYRDFEYQSQPGVWLGQRVVPIERIGVYVPAGRFPLISSLLMGVVPAQVAGVKEVAICSPPTWGGSVHPAILVAANQLGIDEIFRVGGVQAIGALAYGTTAIKKVDKIVGPGNMYVAAAKKEVFGEVGIDFVAGPSEIMVIADRSADPVIVAADLLAQAEHDVNAQAILVTPEPQLVTEVLTEINRQMKQLTTAAIAAEALKNRGVAVVVNSLEDAVRLANQKAPEHLELQVKNPRQVASSLHNYGSLFIGELAAEVLGDYSSGLNHTLPTAQTARYTGGLGVKDFLKIQTTLRVNSQGLGTIGPQAAALAAAEGLEAHVRSVSSRMDK